MSNWTCALTLDDQQKITQGSSDNLCRAIGNAADLRIHTDFRHNEHVDTQSPNDELVNEISEFHETCLLDQRWTVGFMTTRQPVTLPDSFGRPSMSFFMYNQDGRQAIARPHFDGSSPSGPLGPSPLDDHGDMPRYHQHDSWDAQTNAPSSNFIYDFDLIRYFVRDDWQQVLQHDENGSPISGSVDQLAQAFLDGCEVKVAVADLFSDLAPSPQTNIHHETFIQTGWCYYYSQQKLMVAATHPFIRVRPAIPLAYASDAWDFAWLLIRSDGYAKLRIANPYDLTFTDTKRRFAVRWFVK